MFIEIAEFLTCPGEHDEVPCIVAPDEWEGRRVVRGVVACPTCAAEYPVERGRVDFSAGESVPLAAGTGVHGNSGAVQALLNVIDDGGFVALVGSAGLLHVDLATCMPGVHFIAVNPPDVVEPRGSTTVVYGAGRIPLRTASARGVVLGGEVSDAPWLHEGRRILLRGLRLVALAEIGGVAGMEQLAVGGGLWVGVRS